MSLVLAVDVGTTCMKCAIVEDGMHSRAVAEMPYPMNIRGGEQRDIDTGHWWSAFEFCCSSLREFTGDVQAISFSVSTPGAVSSTRMAGVVSGCPVSGRTSGASRFGSHR